jgi:hypothetical protein
VEVSEIDMSKSLKHQKKLPITKPPTPLSQGLCTLVAIAMVHSDNRMTCAITLTLFATGIALSALLIAAYSRPFTGEISVGPELLKQVIASEAAIGAHR